MSTTKPNKYDSFRTADLDDDFVARPGTVPAGGAYAKAGGPPRQERTKNAVRVPLGEIVADEQVRKDFDPKELATLAHSIKERGQLQQALVRWDADRGKYVLIAGERRFRACKLAGLATLDCLVREGDAADEAAELQLIENIVRADLNPIEEAQGYKTLMESRGLDMKGVAAELGVAYSQVQRSMKLLKLPEDLQDRVATGVIPKSLFRQVFKLKTEAEKRAAIDRYLDGVSIAEVAEEVDAAKSGRKAPAKKSTRRFTRGGLTVQASKTGRITTADLIETLEAWTAELRDDRDKRQNRAA